MIRPLRVVYEKNIRGEMFPSFIEDAAGKHVLNLDSFGDESPEIGPLIVCLVNAEPEIVAALEAAERGLRVTRDRGYTVVEGQDILEARELVRAALAKVRP